MTERSNEVLSEREQVRARLKATVDTLTEQANLHTQMQKEPVKMLGGASAIGAVLGMVLGRQLRRSKKIYVDANSSDKHQKALIKAQKKDSSPSVGGALLATVGSLAVKTLTDKVIAPKLEAVAQGFLDKIEQGESPFPKSQTLSKPSQSATSSEEVTTQQSRPSPLSGFLKKPATTSTSPTSPTVQSPSQPTPSQPNAAPIQTEEKTNPNAAHLGVVSMPDSKVEAKAKGSTIADHELSNPNHKQ